MLVLLLFAKVAGGSQFKLVIVADAALRVYGPTKDILNGDINLLV